MQARVLDAAKRLVEAAPIICKSLDLTNVSLAIDDRYDVWDSGLISIPYDFQVKDIQPKLKALLHADRDSRNIDVTTFPRLNCLPLSSRRESSQIKLPSVGFQRNLPKNRRVNKCLPNMRFKTMNSL